ncbi:MAG: PAS domain S-box protein [Bacteroidota bacterium]|nr:PAS domain S-box protein [Bacteroidota bacterium]
MKGKLDNQPVNIQSREKYVIDTMFELTPDYITIQDIDLCYTWVSNPWAGYTEKEIIGKTDFDLFSHEDAEILSKIKQRVLETGKPETCNFPVKDREGEVICLEGLCVPLLNSQGGITGLIGYFRNITERIRMENELSRTKNYLEQLINYTNAPIIVWNPASEIKLFNKAFERLTGYASEEVIGKKLDFLFPDLSLSKSRAMIKQTLYGDFWESIEIPILCKNRETKIVLWNSANIYDNEQNLISTIAQGNDITSRKKAETELEESQRKLNLALESGSIGIWEYHEKGQRFILDERLKKMVKIQQKVFDGTLGSFEKYIHDEDVQQVRDAFRRTLENDEPFETIFRIKLEDSTSRYLIAKGMLYKMQGELSKITGVAIDITEMKEGSERALFKLNEELARSNKELEQFAYVTSHDLQEPLRMVSSFTQMLAERYGDKLDADARDYIKFAVDGSKRMYELINGLLAYSRVRSKGDYFTEVDINEVLEEVLRNISLSIKKRKAEIKIGIMPLIRADRNQMIQVFQNLVSNSIKFSKGIPKISITSKEQEDNYLFSVEDNGIGIDSQYYERIFQIFQRLVTRDEYEGTGIGLSICKRIVERHGGKIWVKSKPGKGSTFLFTIKKDL